jgi:FHA domain-containing protein/type VI secretion system protein
LTTTLNTTLSLRILSYRNQAVPPAPPVRFGAAGGNIGRSPENELVLDDPSKYISRVHARVFARDGAFVLEDLGSNASVVNDRPLGKGQQVALANGDRVLIGDYLLQAVLETAPAAPLLAAAPVNNPALPLFEPPPPPAPVQLPPLDFEASPVAAAAPAPAFLDPLAGAGILDFGPGLGGGGDPLGLNLFAPAPLVPPRAAESDHVSPELAALPRAALAPAYVPPPAPVPGGFAIPHDYDPLADLFPAAPLAAPAPAVPPAQTPAEPPLPVPAPGADAAAQAFADDTAVAAERMTPPAPPIAALPPAPAPAPAHASPAGEDAVLQALLRGLGLPNLQLQRPATEVAETVGAMLRIATEGTIDVLMARALTKKESRIDMTMLSVRANNPLKFFPHADGALTQMLTGAMAGYMAPEEAMAGAFDDLRAHELAVIAGMRAALGAVLQRFDPSKIEARLAVPTVMDKVLLSNRKAKLWDRLVELYGEIAREADDDLQRLYGEKFSEAYEEQVARLRAAKG